MNYHNSQTSLALTASLAVPTRFTSNHLHSWQSMSLSPNSYRTHGLQPGFDFRIPERVLQVLVLQSVVVVGTLGMAVRESLLEEL